MMESRTGCGGTCGPRERTAFRRKIRLERERWPHRRDAVARFRLAGGVEERVRCLYGSQRVSARNDGPKHCHATQIELILNLRAEALCGELGVTAKELNGDGVSANGGLPGPVAEERYRDNDEREPDNEVSCVEPASGE